MKRPKKKNILEIEEEKTNYVTLNQKIKDRRLAINRAIEDARTEATFKVLRDNCNEIDIKIEKRFCQIPVLYPEKCPIGNCYFCDNCEYMVQYSLKKKKVYCIGGKKLD